jgi:hypothetical protein
LQQCSLAGLQQVKPKTVKELNPYFFGLINQESVILFHLLALLGGGLRLPLRRCGAACSFIMQLNRISVI